MIRPTLMALNDVWSYKWIVTDEHGAEHTFCNPNLADAFYRIALANFSSATADEQHRSPAGEEGEPSMYGITEGNLITDGTLRAVVKAATDSFIVACPEDGGDEFVLNAGLASSWTVIPTDLVIERRFVVYAPDGTRVDGYKFESRARRNNNARFEGKGYWLGEMKPEYFTWVPA